LALGDNQRRAQGGLHDQLLLRTLGGVGQGGEYLQPFREVRDRFQIGRALNGALPRLLPVGESLRCEPGLGIVMGQQLGLRLAALRKMRLQHLGNALVVLLAGTPQQRLIGRVLDQGMLEEICRLWW
jgi:hypothetical protein